MVPFANSRHRKHFITSEVLFNMQFQLWQREGEITALSHKDQWDSQQIKCYLMFVKGYIFGQITEESSRAICRILAMGIELSLGLTF